MSYQQQPPMPEGSYNAATGTVLYAQPRSQIPTHRSSQGQAQAAQGDAAMASMMTAFSQTHLVVPNTNVPANTGMVPGGANQQGYPGGNQFFYTSDGQIVYIPATNIYPAPSMGPNQLAEGNYGAYGAAQYAPQATYQSYVPTYPILPYTPARAGYYPDRSDVIQKDVPGLENRRGSYSTTESAPGTPYYGSLSQRGQGTQIVAVDRSPIYSTPSPDQVSHTIVHHGAKPLPYKPVPIGFNLDALLMLHPAIPRAVPAVFTPRESMRTLEQSLSNPINGNRNVYIRGLHPNTGDATLAAYAARFGEIETSKAIIDTSTGACKGFGFAKYFEARDSEMCIRGFYKLGYEVGFARESFNSRLKAEGDENSTNLYVSNLPKNMTEAELGAIFMDYTVSSSRILKDTQGQSRGVGFARFETREICEEIIAKFHGQPIGEEGLLLQVRYADTPAQKDLKRVTTERRQFRTTEYNVGAYGTPADIIALSPTISSPVLPRMAQIARHLPQSRSSGSWKRHISSGNSNGSSAGGSFAASGVAFKDVDNKADKKSPGTDDEAQSVDRQSEFCSPTASEVGSADESVTIQCVTPANDTGGPSAIPTIKKI